jgi:hypothetical protein
MATLALKMLKAARDVRRRDSAAAVRHPTGTRKWMR